jgi:hypothetical protein
MILKGSSFTIAGTLALGIAVGAGMTTFVNATQHAKVIELPSLSMITETLTAR